MSFRTGRGEGRMSRDQNHSHFQQRNLVGKLEPANMLNEVNYRRHGFDGRGAALSSLDLSRPSMGLDQRMPSLNLDRRDLDRRGTVPPRPSSMLSDGGSATSLESSPRFVKFFITIIIVIFVQFFTTIIIVIISALTRNEEAGSPENRIAALEEEKHEESFDEVGALAVLPPVPRKRLNQLFLRGWATSWQRVLAATSATTVSLTRQTLSTT